MAGPGLGDLPEDCIAAILGRTTPKDVATLACVSKVFRNASNRDSVWQMMLPSYFDEILAQAPDGAPARTSPKKQIFEYLANRVLLENGTQDFWLDRETGGVCRSVGARALSVVWGNDQRYWTWVENHHGSRFADTAYLIEVCWLEIKGNFTGSLSPGVYTLSWRLSFSEDAFAGFRNVPVKFSFEASGNEPVHFQVDLIRVMTDAGNQWLEVFVGEFTVERGDEPVKINFSMLQKDSDWKSGMFLDSVIIRHTSVRV